MKIFRKLAKVFRSYSDIDKAISFACLGIVMLMIFKMIVFPYGLFNFGDEKVYTEGLVGENGFQNLNPLFVDYNELDREVCKLVFSGLMKYDSRQKSIVGDMASLTINEDKTEYTFVLKSGLKWHDGQPLTTDDVFFTFAYIIQDPSFQNDVLKADFDGVEITQIDSRTIKFKLPRPNIFFITNMTTGILPKHILESVPADALLYSDFNKKPIGSGPYVVTEPIQQFKDGRMQVTLKMNPTYYGVNPKIEKYRFISYPTMNELIDEITAVNGIVKVYGKYAADLKTRGDYIVMPYELPQYMAVFINTDRVKYSKIRTALLRSIDRDKLLEDISDKKAVASPVLDIDQSPLFVSTDVELAKRMLADAQYTYPKPDSKFRTDSDGEILKLSLLAREFPEGSQQGEEFSAVLKFLEKTWEDIGIQIDVNILPVDQLNERIMNRDYDLLLMGQTLGYASDDAYSFWHSSQVDTNGLNLSNYKSFQVDSLIEQVRLTFESEKRLEKLKTLATQLVTDVPAIFLYRPIYYYASDDKVEGIKVDGMAYSSDRFSNLEEWHFSN